MTQPCALYRHFDAAGRLLYVGISLSAIGRLSGHRAKPWFRDIANMTTQWHSTRQDAEAAEREAIRDEMPLHNKQRYGAPAPGAGVPPSMKPKDPLAAYVTTWGMRDVEIAMGSPLRRKLFAEGKLRPLDYEKWDAGGYGLDPFSAPAPAPAAQVTA